ncbi:hypothetical protein [Actinacidiphila glaucinigra]|uniref:hypothetical protein n=1 Tax=Actinacidiphila glaucinigra TaxID=235986 RepID=UPI0029BF3ECE|nr:hypothetical protein [Streptomyces sp. PA03-3a]
MDASQLTTEDHASADRAQQLLADRFHSAPSLYVQMRSWEYFVVGVEEGYDTTWVFEYHNDIACRDWLHEALPILTPAMRMFCLERLEPLDARYRAATGPVKSFDAQSGPRPERERWWRDRYPLLIDHDENVELPAAWSPAPRRTT